MSEELKSEETIDPNQHIVDVIKEDAIVSIPMSTGYYKRIQELTKHIVETKSEGVMELAHESIRDQKISEPWVFHYETLLILCNEFEKAARAGDFIHQMTAGEFQKHVQDVMNQDTDVDAVAEDEPEA